MISEATMTAFRDKVKAAARELGLEAENVNISYSDYGFSFTGKVFEGNEGRFEEFSRVANRKGFPTSWYGKTFKSNGEEYVITGAAARGRKYPILAKRLSDNASYKFSIDYVRNV